MLNGGDLVADGYKGDGMPNLNVKSIERVYYSTSSCWARPAFEARRYDGLVLFTEGEIEYDFGYTKITATAGDILIFPGNLPYSGVKRCDGNVSFYVIDFECFSVDELQSLNLPLRIKTNDTAYYEEHFSKILSVYTENTISVKLRLKAELYELIYRVYELCNPIIGNCFVGDILRYIGQNFRNPELRVTDICAEFFVSESQLRRNIRRATGLSPNDYIKRLRIDFAKNELSFGDRAIKDVSAMSGFSSQYYFSKCFSASVGMSPSEYRRHTLMM